MSWASAYGQAPMGKCLWASAYGHSQLQHQHLRVGGYTENLLKWFNYPHARAHLGREVNCYGTKWTCIVSSSVIRRGIVSSSVIRRGQPDSGESCIMLQSGPIHSLIAKYPRSSVVACSTQISCCRGRTLRTRPWMGVCEPLMPDVVSPKVHQNNCRYVSSADLPLDSI